MTANAAPKTARYGRKPLPAGQRTTTSSCRLTPEGWAKYKELGGNKWLARMVEREHAKLAKAKAKQAAQESEK